MKTAFRHQDATNTSDNTVDLLSNHAKRRLNQRGIRKHLVDLVLEYGRAIYTRGACIMVIGRKEVQSALKRGLDLRACEGIQVVCCPAEGLVYTVYRNRGFSGLKQGRVRHRIRRPQFDPTQHRASQTKDQRY